MGIGCEDRVLRVGSHRIRVRVQHGDDGGLPLLLLNGVGAPLELWQPLLRHLPGVTTIAMDAPGCGGSSTPLQPLTIQGHARLAVQVLDRLGISSFSVLGFSFGGLVAQEVARLAGPRMHRLVLASTSCGWGGVPGSPRALLAINTPDRYYDRSLFEAAAPEYIGGEETANEDFLQEQARIRSAHPPNRRGYFHQCWAASIWVQPALAVPGADRHPGDHRGLRSARPPGQRLDPRLDAAARAGAHRARGRAPVPARASADPGAGDHRLPLRRSRRSRRSERLRRAGQPRSLYSSSRRRPTTMRWMSAVPSPMSSMGASR
ncbi:MAG: alpha/beta fold hydrolase [Actinomycetota bacterium]|nr:alpha/beta fold hydrolase [Actinomycetota bacterium]